MTRIDPFKLTEKRQIVDTVAADAGVAGAARAHAKEHGITEDAARARVRAYLREIVPEFSLLYYRFGLKVAERVLRLFFKLEIDDRGSKVVAALPPDSIVVYLMNHRSNADYVLAGYALGGHVAISYAVGEWARVFPLEYLFKSFGAYFIRRRFREPLYHTVLERYVQLITKNGVTQGIFPEGGLSRDGKLRPVKIGLLDYALGVAREPGFAERLYVVPVAINYDRVLEDRSLLRELHPERGHRPPGLLTQLGIVTWYVAWNAVRIVFRRWKRHGDAAVVVGEPVQVAPWLRQLEEKGRGLFSLSREDRLGEVQTLANLAMQEVGKIIPVTAVPLVCAAIQTFDAEFIGRGPLIDRIEDVRASLLHHQRHVVRPEESIEEVLDRAYELLRMRRALTREGESYVVLPRGRELVSYYANSVAHLLGEFEAAVRARDTVPVYAVVDL